MQLELTAKNINNEKEFQLYYFKILQTKHIEYFHINPKGGKYQKKDFPDLLFAYNNIYYMREFGIKGSNNDRKESQKELMLKWFNNASKVTNIKILFNFDDVNNDLKEIGLIK
jgi:hypothetical protein